LVISTIAGRSRRHGIIATVGAVIAIGAVAAMLLAAHAARRMEVVELRHLIARQDLCQLGLGVAFWSSVRSSCLASGGGSR